jgi:hypothetical protein
VNKVNQFCYAPVDPANCLVFIDGSPAFAKNPESFDGSELKSTTSKIEFSQEFSKENLQKSQD